MEKWLSSGAGNLQEPGLPCHARKQGNYQRLQVTCQGDFRAKLRKFPQARDGTI